MALRLLANRPASRPSCAEWPRIRAEIDAGHPSVVGLIRATGISPWRLTQEPPGACLGLGGDAGGRVTLRVYDPNHPGRDDVELQAVVADGPAAVARPDHVAQTTASRSSGSSGTVLSQTTGEPLLGFFLQPYPPPQSVAAWR